MDIVISPGLLQGRVSIPASKSAAHRAMLCAALAPGVSTLFPVQPIQDILVTLNAVRALGAAADLEDGMITVKGGLPLPCEAAVDCVESGSTLRFLTPIVAALGLPTRFSGRGQLPNRPMTPLTDELARHGAVFNTGGQEMLSVSGQLQPGQYRLAGDISSQYITGLLLALPLLKGDSEIVLTSPLQSAGYVDMTLQTLAQFGVKVDAIAGKYRIKGKQIYHPQSCAIEGDYSGAAFWLAAGVLYGGLEVSGLDAHSLQGDKAIVNILSSMGGKLKIAEDRLIKASPQSLHNIQLDVSQIPDLLPILAVTAVFAQGVTTLSGAARLRIKESDRLHTVTAGLQALGAIVEEHPDALVITGGKPLVGGVTVDSFGDHRIAMALSIAALGCQQPVTITGVQCVSKSYPDFYKDFQELGGVYHVL